MGLLFIYDNKPSQSAWRVRTSRRGSLERYGRAATLRVRNPPDLDVKGLVGQWTFFKLTASLHVGWQAAKSWRYAFSWWSCPSLLRSCQVLVGLVIFFSSLSKHPLFTLTPTQTLSQSTMATRSTRYLPKNFFTFSFSFSFSLSSFLPSQLALPKKWFSLTARTPATSFCECLCVAPLGVAVTKRRCVCGSKPS